MAITYWYGIVLLYPIISALINKYLLGNGDAGIFSHIGNEYWLLGAIGLCYAGFVSFFFYGTGFVLSQFWALVLFSIVYFAISLVRKTIWTEHKEEPALQKLI